MIRPPEQALMASHAARRIRSQLDTDAMERPPCPSDLGRMAQHYGEMHDRADGYHRARSRAAFITALLWAVLLGLLIGWLATQAIAKAAHDVVHAEQWRP